MEYKLTWYSKYNDEISIHRFKNIAYCIDAQNNGFKTNHDICANLGRIWS